jgi:hypothetical protein
LLELDSSSCKSRGPYRGFSPLSAWNNSLIFMPLVGFSLGSIDPISYYRVLSVVVISATIVPLVARYPTNACNLVLNC